MCSVLRRCGLTFQLHADGQALLKAAEWAAFALRFVDLAVLVLNAGVPLIVLNGALEEALG